MVRDRTRLDRLLKCVSLSMVLIVLLLSCAAFVQAAKILHLGDSHTAGPYGRELHAQLKAAGHTVESYGCVGASARNYAGSPKECKDRTPGADGKMILIGSRKDDVITNYQSPSADAAISAFNPDIVIVSLGANYLTNPAESAKLVEKLKGTTCYWVGPPNGPNKDAAGMTRFYDGLKSVAGHCTVIDSRPLTQFNFCGDKICCCDKNVHFDAYGASGVAAAKAWASGVVTAIQKAPGAPTTKTSPLPVCEGGDLTKLSGQYEGCLKYKDIFDKYAKEQGVYDLGVDLLTLFVIAVGESGCKTREQLLAKGDKTANGGIMQVDSPCLFQPDKCPTIDDEIEWGIKYVKRGVEKVLAKGYTGETALSLYFFAYNRGEGAMDRAVDNMKEKGMALNEAADESCSYYYGYPGSPDNGKCGVKRSNGNQPCKYDFYCGSDVRDSDNKLTGVHYATKRIKWLKSACESIGGVFKEGAAVTSQLGPNASLTSSYLYGIDPKVLAPYSVIPSFTLTMPSVIGLFDEAINKIPDLESCAADLDCVANKLTALNSRDNAPVWLAKYSGKVLPSAGVGTETTTYHWTHECETSSEYIANSFAEGISSLKGSINDDCILKLELSQPAGWTDFESWVGRYPDAVFDASGSTARISFPGAKAVQVDGVKLSIDDGSIKSPSNDKLDFDDVNFAKPLILYRENKDRFILAMPGQEGKYESKAECNISKRRVKLCLFDKDISIWKYDPGQKKIVDKAARVRFAYDFERRMTDVESMDVLPALFASETVLVTWKKISAVDVPKYDIYYSEVNNLFLGAPTDSFSSDPALMADVKTIRVDVSDMPSENIFNSTQMDSVPDCAWDDEDLGFCNPRYKATNATGHEVFAQFKPGNVYFDRSRDTYVYVLSGVPNDKVLNYGVIGIDKDDVLSPRVKGPEQPGFAVDDVPPVPPADLSVKRTAAGGLDIAWSVVDVKNIDASLADDISNYLVFCTPESKTDFVSMGGEAGALTVVSTSPASVDQALFDSKCRSDYGIILLPKDSSGNIFKWPTSSVEIR